MAKLVYLILIGFLTLAIPYPTMKKATMRKFGPWEFEKLPLMLPPCRTVVTESDPWKILLLTQLKNQAEQISNKTDITHNTHLNQPTPPHNTKGTHKKLLKFRFMLPYQFQANLPL